MASIVDKIILPVEYDRRRKLNAEQKDEIIHKYSTGLYSQRALSREYNVDRNTIKFLINPTAYEHSKELSKERRKDGRYAVSTEKRTQIQKEHRAYKKDLLSKGLISPKNTNKGE